MFLLFVLKRQKGKIQDNQDKEASKDKVHTQYKRMRKKFPVRATFSAPFQAGSMAHLASYKMGTESLSWG
jgi:acetyl-CoA carboxylase beta subunit